MDAFSEPTSALARATIERRLAEHLPSLRAHARRLTRDGSRADDLVQDTVVRALAFAWSFEAGTNLRAWLHQILMSVFITNCRSRARERRALDSMGRDPCLWVHKEAAPEMRELSRPVASALSRLPAGFRDVVRLVDVEERSYKDAATELAVPLGTVMSRLHRGRRLLASALSECEHSPRAAA